MTSLASCIEVPFARAKKRFSWDLVVQAARLATKYPVLVCEGALECDGDLVVDDLLERYAALVVLGDLSVSGSIVNLDAERGFLVEVQGKTTAKNVLVGGARVHLWQDVAVKNLVWAHGARGYLKVLSPLRAGAILRTSRNADFEGAMRGAYVDLLRAPPGPRLAGAVLTKGKPDLQKVWAAVQKGKKVVA